MIYTGLNSCFCTTLKRELIQQLKSDNLYSNKTEVHVFFRYDITERVRKLMVVINRKPLICIPCDETTNSSDTTYKVFRAYEKSTGGEINDRYNKYGL